MEVGRLSVRVGADIGDLTSKMSAAASAVNSLGEKMERAGQRLTLGLSAPLAALGALSVRSAASMDSLTRGLTAVAGSSAAAQLQLKRLEGVAKLPGLGFREAIQGSINLQAAGFSAALAEDALRGFGNALATVGKGKAELDGVITALGQIASKGKVSAEEINQIAERVPQIRKVMQDAFGTADTEKLQKAQIDATTFVRKVTDELLKLEQVTGGPANAFENLSDAVFRASAALGERLLPAVLPVVEGMARMLEQARSLEPSTVRWAIALGGAAAVMGPLIGTIGTLTQAYVALAVAGKSAALVVGVGAPLLVGLAALSALFIKNKMDSLAAAGAVSDYNAKLAALDETTAKFRVSDLGKQADDLRKKLAATPKEIPIAVAGFAAGKMGASSGTAANPEYKRLQDQLRVVNEQFRVVTRRVTDLRTEGTAATAPLVSGLGEVDKKMKGLIERAQELGLSIMEGLDIKDALAKIPTSMQAYVDIVAGRMPKIELATNKPLPVIIKGGLPNGFLATPALSRIADARQWGPAPATGALASITQGISGFIGALKVQLASLAASFGPLAIAAAVLAPVFRGLMDTLGPTLAAISVPLRMMGAILGTMIVPVLKLLFHPLQYLGIAVAFVSEWILRAVGTLVKGIGKLVDKLPGVSGGPLIRFGEEMLEHADAIKKSKRELADMSFDDAMKKATESVKAFTDSVFNMSEAFDYAYRRQQVTGGTLPASVMGASGARAPVQVSHSGPIVQGVVIQAAPGDSEDELWEKFMRAVRKNMALGGTSDLDLMMLHHTGVL